MIKELKSKNFTVLKNVDLQFSKDINIIIGENGTGKTHVLKLLYAILSVYSSSLKRNHDGSFTKEVLQKTMADKITNVFRSDQLGRLTTRKQGRERAEIAIECSHAELSSSFSFASNSKTEVIFDKQPERSSLAQPVFFPAKELLTLYPKFIGMYKDFYVQYDETFYDTMLLLGRQYLKKGPHEKSANELILPLEDAIGGRIYLNRSGDSFYMKLNGDQGKSGDMEINLVAEGWRKFGMLTQIILNGALKDKGYIFWDEPEANLNPRLIKVLAKTIFDLSLNNKIQVFIATHSLFLLRELELLSKQKQQSQAIRYFSFSSNGCITQSYNSYDLQTIVALDEEISQSDRIMAYSRGPR